jgi:hypothetical protein
LASPAAELPLAKPLPLLTRHRVDVDGLLTDETASVIEGAVATPATERLVSVADRLPELDTTF